MSDIDHDLKVQKLSSVEEEWLREVVPFYTVEHLYTDSTVSLKNKSEKDSEILRPKKNFSVWAVKDDRHNVALIVYDKEGRISETTREYSLVPLSDSEYKDMLKRCESLRPKLIKVAQGWRCTDPRGNTISEKNPILEDIDLLHYPYVLAPVPRLREPSYLKHADWKGLVDKIVAFNTEEKEDVLKLSHRSAILKGLDPKINPHRIEVTIGGTGKTLFYDTAGLDVGKATSASFLGFAKSPVEIYPGTIDGLDLPVGIDQLESQSAPEIMRYLFNIMESGRDLVSNGAIKFEVESSSTFAFLANPIGYSINPTKSFAELIDHLSSNPAMGRRFGIILYYGPEISGRPFKKITKKPDQKTEEGWKRAIQEFRAVEEYCISTLRGIIQKDEIWGWLNSPIDGYANTIQDLAKSIQDSNVADFLVEHGAGAQTRVRGAALYAALADNLAKVALGEYDVTGILDDAGEYLARYVEQNLTSITNICQQWGREKAVLTKAAFDNLPEYMKEIVSAIELHKRLRPERNVITLDGLAYKPGSKGYKTFNECMVEFSKRKRKDEHIRKFKERFGFEIKQVGDQWEVTILETKPIEEIAPIGTLAETLALPFLPSSTSSESTPESHISQIPQKDQTSSGTSGISGNLRVSERLRASISTPAFVCSVCSEPILRGQLNMKNRDGTKRHIRCPEG
jgi:hypothetical protein